MKNKEASERILFFTLWGLMFIGFGIWKFWPDSGRAVAVSLPPLTIASELKTLFDQGSTTQSLPTFFTVQLHVAKRYRELLSGDEKKIFVGYQLLREDRVLSEGVVPCVIRPQDATVTLALQNPERVFPRSIQVFLSH
jgi:hypothetical protein